MQVTTLLAVMVSLVLVKQVPAGKLAPASPWVVVTVIAYVLVVVILAALAAWLDGQTCQVRH